ncbi:MAG: anaerobic ribonucleoside-triphosphate reductase activating protein [Bacteroidales bacterium]|nr:anaerobic ribonucleoside-triphosphate reductase activating protein [Bacteroidales bacterium]
MFRIRILDILEETMADGPGLRTAIYCAGCAHHCPDCHNPQSWDFAGGHEMTVDELLEIVKADEFSNVSFSGGDPFYQVEAFTELARRIKEETGKTIWCWTGFTYEEILADSRLSMLLPYIDVLVDGPFVIEKKDPELLFRGSSNQRIIYLTEHKEDVIPGTVPLKPAK